LALQLLTFKISKQPLALPSASDWLSELNVLSATRHLTIQLKKPSGELISVSQHRATAFTEKPPLWFIRLLGADYPKAESRSTVRRVNASRFMLELTRLMKLRKSGRKARFFSALLWFCWVAFF
jgi:two-component system sensor histidine kinase UhpB